MLFTGSCSQLSSPFSFHFRGQVKSLFRLASRYSISSWPFSLVSSSFTIAFRSNLIRQLICLSTPVAQLKLHSRWSISTANGPIKTATSSKSHSLLLKFKTAEINNKNYLLQFLSSKNIYFSYWTSFWTRNWIVKKLRIFWDIHFYSVPCKYWHKYITGQRISLIRLDMFGHGSDEWPELRGKSPGNGRLDGECPRLRKETARFWIYAEGFPRSTFRDLMCVCVCRVGVVPRSPCFASPYCVTIERENVALFHLVAHTPELPELEYVADPRTVGAGAETTNGTKNQLNQPQRTHGIPTIQLSILTAW